MSAAPCTSDSHSHSQSQTHSRSLSSSSSSSSSLHTRSVSRSSSDFFFSLDLNSRYQAVQKQIQNRGKVAIQSLDRLTKNFLGDEEQTRKSVELMAGEDDAIQRIGLNAYRAKSLAATQDQLGGELMERMREMERVLEAVQLLEGEMNRMREITAIAAPPPKQR